MTSHNRAFCTQMALTHRFVIISAVAKEIKTQPSLLLQYNLGQHKIALNEWVRVLRIGKTDYRRTPAAFIFRKRPTN